MSKKKIPGLLILAVAAVGLGGTYFALASTNDPARTGVLFAMGNGETVESISLTNTYGSYEFTKEDDEWIVHSDGDFRTNPEKMDLLVSSLEEVPVTRVMEETAPEYGLDDPVAQVSFTTSKGKTHSFMVGNETASRSSVYILDPENGKPMLTTDAAVAQLTGSLSAYRAKDVLTVDTTAIQQIRYYENNELILEVGNTDYQNWFLTQPYEAPARRVVLTELVNKMAGWTVAGYPEGEDDAAMGLDNPARVLEVTDAAGNTQRVEFGRDDGTNVYARTAGTDEVVKLYSVDCDFSGLTPEQVMFVSPLTTTVDQLSSISVTVGGKAVSFFLENQDGEMVVTSSEGDEVKYSDFISVLSKFMGHNADGYDPQHSIDPGEEPVALLQMETLDGQVTQLELYQRDEETLAMLVDGHTRYHLPVSDLEELIYRINSALGRTVLTLG